MHRNLWATINLYTVTHDCQKNAHSIDLLYISHIESTVTTLQHPMKQKYILYMGKKKGFLKKIFGFCIIVWQFDYFTLTTGTYLLVFLMHLSLTVGLALHHCSYDSDTSRDLTFFPLPHQVETVFGSPNMTVAYHVTGGDTVYPPSVVMEGLTSYGRDKLIADLRQYLPLVTALPFPVALWRPHPATGFQLKTGQPLLIQPESK